MFLIQRRKSICRTVSLIILLEFISADEDISDQTICGSRNKRSISYLEVNSAELNWTAAWKHCNDKKSNLPLICNQHEQGALMTYLKKNIGSSEAWISGRKISFDEWKWIDGQPFDSRALKQPLFSTDTHGAIEAYAIYKSQRPTLDNYYICQYSGSSCNSENVINVTKGCVTPIYDFRTWYDARYQCLRNNSDLAILNHSDLEILRRTDNRHSYWIGLRRNKWHWIWQGTVSLANSSEEIKYTNWLRHPYSLSEDCIFIDALNGTWKASRCDEKKKVVCERILDPDDSTSSSTTRALPRTMSSTKTSRPTMSYSSSRPTPSMSETMTQTMTEGHSTANPQVLLYAGVGAGIVIIVICIIVIIVAVRYTRKSPEKIHKSKGENNSDPNRRDESPNKPSSSPANAPVNAPISEADDTRGVYAEISLAELNQSEDGKMNQPPGIVYASLEFKKEPTYLEPDKKLTHTSAPTKTGPIGDIIYAIPDAKDQAVASPGNESASHPIKVTPQGDVYALPVKNSKSPTTNTPGGGIYANL